MFAHNRLFAKRFRRKIGAMVREKREVDVRVYLLSLGVGLLVGIFYALLNVRSPAPPIIGLLGLFGMLLGEQAAPIAMRWLQGQTNIASAPTPENANNPGNEE